MPRLYLWSISGNISLMLVFILSSYHLYEKKTSMHPPLQLQSETNTKQYSCWFQFHSHNTTGQLSHKSNRLSRSYVTLVSLFLLKHSNLFFKKLYANKETYTSSKILFQNHWLGILASKWSMSKAIQVCNRCLSNISYWTWLINGWIKLLTATKGICDWLVRQSWHQMQLYWK